jgi:hypothetical protein
VRKGVFTFGLFPAELSPPVGIERKLRRLPAHLRIPYWSNRRMLHKGEPTGRLTEDNARVILEQVEIPLTGIDV